MALTGEVLISHLLFQHGDGSDRRLCATAFDAAHPDWLACMPGRLIVATHV